MTTGTAYVAKRVDLAWKRYAQDLRDDICFDAAPKAVRTRWVCLEPLLENAFKHGAAAGGCVSMEMLNSIRNS